MFGFRDFREGDVRVDVAFTDASLDLQGTRPRFAAALTALEEATDVRFARLNQVHGSEVLVVEEPSGPPDGPVATGDALVTTRTGLGLMIRVADCVPVVLADPQVGVLGAVHAGRQGMRLDIVTRAVEAMRQRGAGSDVGDVVGWIGPHVCAGCYEVPEQMREEVCARIPEAWAETRWGTPSVDLGAGVRAQLERAGVVVEASSTCTREDATLHSHRRDGAQAGRFAALVWMS